MADSDLSDSETVFEVESILEQRQSSRSVEYLVRWKGFTGNEDSWELARNLKQYQDLIDAFHEFNGENIPCSQSSSQRSTRQADAPSRSSSQRSTKSNADGPIVMQSSQSSSQRSVKQSEPVSRSSSQRSTKSQAESRENSSRFTKIKDLANLESLKDAVIEESSQTIEDGNHVIKKETKTVKHEFTSEISPENSPIMTRKTTKRKLITTITEIEPNDVGVVKARSPDDKKNLLFTALSFIIMAPITILKFVCHQIVKFCVFILNMIAWICSHLCSSLLWLLSGIQSSLIGLKNVIKSIFSGLFSFISSPFSKIQPFVTGCKNFTHSLFSGCTYLVKSIFMGFKFVLKGLINGLKYVLKSVVCGIQYILSAMIASVCSFCKISSNWIVNASKSIYMMLKRIIGFVLLLPILIFKGISLVLSNAKQLLLTLLHGLHSQANLMVKVTVHNPRIAILIISLIIVYATIIYESYVSQPSSVTESLKSNSS